MGQSQPEKEDRFQNESDTGVTPIKAGVAPDFETNQA
jgi:hypothetical protein